MIDSRLDLEFDHFDREAEQNDRERAGLAPDAAEQRELFLHGRALDDESSLASAASTGAGEIAPGFLPAVAAGAAGTTHSPAESSEGDLPAPPTTRSSPGASSSSHRPPAGDGPSDESEAA